MSRLIKLGALLVALAVLIGGGIGLALSRTSATSVLVASETPIPTDTLPPTFTPTASATPTTTPTTTFTPSPTASSTATLATLVLQVTAINPDVTLDAPAAVLPILSTSPRPT